MTRRAGLPIHVRTAVLVVCALPSACATLRSQEPLPLEVASPKTAEAVRDCILAGAGERLPAGVSAPRSTSSSRVNGYLITIPPMVHTGIVVSRGPDGASTVRWHSLDPERFPRMPDLIKSCAAP